MNPRYAAHIQLPFDLDLRSLAIFSCDQRKLGHTMRDQSLVDPQLTVFLAERNIKIGHAEAFYTPPKSRLPAHVDHDKLTDLAKMNFVYGANGSTMSWWQMKNPNVKHTVKLTSIKTKYISVDESQADCIETARIGRPTLVNVGQPHSVDNPTPYMRWCLSLVMWGADTKKDLTIQECIERLQGFIK